MKRKSQGKCYYCGCAAFTREHVPPKLFFRGFSCDSITVPSCDLHNSEKSGDDQAVRDALLLAYRNALARDRDHWNLRADLQKAVLLAKTSFAHTKKRAIDTPLVNDARLPNVGFLDPSVKVSLWMRQLTAALVCDATRPAVDASADWDEADVFSPDRLPTDKWEPWSSQRVLAILGERGVVARDIERLPFRHGWSSSPRPYPPDIYAFSVSLRQDDVVFRHRFYGSYRWYVRFDASRAMIARLCQKCGGK